MNGQRYPGGRRQSAEHDSLTGVRQPAEITAAERDFFAALQQVAPTGHQIFAHVRLANLVQVKASARRDKSHWWRIQAKCLDFVLVDAATFAPRLVVELDDSSHDRADRRDRDAFVDDVLAAAGIPILHVRWQRHYDARALADQLASRLGIGAPTPIARSALQAVPAAEAEGLWRPIPISPAPAPLYDGSPVAASAPAAAASSIAPAPVAPSRRACGQCQAELREGARFCPQCGVVFGV
jgi:very-short-patch-repair endonuclease